MWCKILSSRSNLPLVVISGMDKVDFVIAFRWVDAPVPDGAFSVEADRQLCCRITQSALDAKLARLAVKRRYRSLYRYLAGRYEDYIGAPPLKRNPNVFLSDFRFASLDAAKKQRRGMGAVACAVLSSDTSMLRYLVGCGAKLDQRIPELWELALPQGCTPLHLAAIKGSSGVGVLQELLMLRADANTKEQNGGHVLCYCRDKQAIELLVE